MFSQVAFSLEIEALLKFRC